MLYGKRALITGASRGIGRAIAIEMAKQGALVGLNYKNNLEEAEKTYEAIRKQGGQAILLPGDVGDYSTAISLIDSMVQQFGGLEVLINNAGISSIGLFMDMKEEQWNKVFSTNMKGVINTCHAAAKFMISKKQGSIVNISSIWGSCGASCETIYSAAKGAVNSFTKALGKELGGCGIRVNAIAPGVVDTDMNACFNEEEKSDIIASIPLGRMGHPEEIAKLAAFLASDDSSYINAQVITVDGGLL